MSTGMITFGGRFIKELAIKNSHYSDVLADALAVSKTAISHKLYLMHNLVAGLTPVASANELDVTTVVQGVALNDNLDGSESKKGIVTSGSYNKVSIKKAGTQEPLEYSANGPDIYGRLVDEAGVLKLKFFYLAGGTTETAYTIPAEGVGNIDIMFPESMELMDIPFSGFATGAAFGEALPIDHTHNFSDVIGVTESGIEISDLVTYSGASLTNRDLFASAALVGNDNGSGANLVGFYNVDGATSGHFMEADATVQDALASIVDEIEALEAIGGALKIGFNEAGIEAGKTLDGATTVQGALVTLAGEIDAFEAVGGATKLGFTQTASAILSDATSVQNALEQLETAVIAAQGSLGVVPVAYNNVAPAEAPTGSLAVFTVTGGYNAGSLCVYVDGQRQFAGVQFDETSASAGTFTFHNDALPQSGEAIRVDYILTPAV